MSNLVLVYRTGGRENFKWNRSLEVATYTEACIKSDALTVAGYKNYILDAELSRLIGLPETFDSASENDSKIFTGWML